MRAMRTVRAMAAMGAVARIHVGRAHVQRGGERGGEARIPLHQRAHGCIQPRIVRVRCVGLCCQGSAGEG